MHASGGRSNLLSELPSTPIIMVLYFIEVDSRDFRAWYGLGQTHEILKMHHYSLYYYQQALKLRPNDSRMLMAVGCAYKLLNKPQQAKICFWKAHMLGDPEGIALTHLAK